VGRLVEEKGLHTLLRAVAGLPGGWLLLLVGDGPLKAQIEERAAQLGIRERIELTSVPSDKVPEVMGKLDVLVLPSITRPNWKEQFGRVLIEAMACGVPVVGSDSGEIPNVIGDAGLVFPEGDELELRRHLAHLMAEPRRREILIARGHKRVEAHYTQRRIAEETYQMYLRVLARSFQKAPYDNGCNQACKEETRSEDG